MRRVRDITDTIAFFVLLVTVCWSVAYFNVEYQQDLYEDTFYWLYGV